MKIKLLKDITKSDKIDYGRKFIMLFDKIYEKPKAIIDETDFEIIIIEYIKNQDFKGRLGSFSDFFLDLVKLLSEKEYTKELGNKLEVITDLLMKKSK